METDQERFHPLTMEEAVDACLDYGGKKSFFDLERRSFVHKGWGSPRLIDKILSDENQAMSVVDRYYAARWPRFKKALSEGALIAFGKKAPAKQGQRVEISRDETMYLEFMIGENCALHEGKIVYVDLQFVPRGIPAFEKPHVKAKVGRPSLKDEIFALHEVHKHRLQDGKTTQKAYARFIQNDLPARNGKRIELETITKHLRTAGKI